MDTLPLELHSQIFEFACLDDGSTARSLALVSRYVHNVSATFRYQSLSIAGLTALTKLADILEGLPHHRRRVRNLLLSDWTQKETLQAGAGDAEQSDAAEAAIIRILNIIAPTLEALTFMAFSPFTSTSLVGHLFSLRLPRLHELSVHGFYPFPHLPGSMPRLQRLHLSGNRNPHGLLQAGGLSAACPGLCELEISGLVAASSFAEELERALLIEVDEEKPTLFGVVLSKSVRLVTVATGEAPSRSRRNVSLHAKMNERLDNLALSTSKLGEVRFQCVHGRAQTGVYANWRSRWGAS